jgi:hypothetical protein
METINSATSIRVPWNKGKLVGQKAPFKLKEIWAIRVRLQMASRCRELALFNLAMDSKLRACDLVQLRVRDVCHGQSMASRDAAPVGSAGRRPARSGPSTKNSPNEKGTDHRHRSSGRPAAGNDNGFSERSPIFLLADRIHRPQLRQQLVDQRTQPRPRRAVRE